jgi:hypothetical protein
VINIYQRVGVDLTQSLFLISKYFRKKFPVKSRNPKFSGNYFFHSHTNLPAFFGQESMLTPQRMHSSLTIDPPFTISETGRVPEAHPAASLAVNAAILPRFNVERGEIQRILHSGPNHHEGRGKAKVHAERMSAENN